MSPLTPTERLIAVADKHKLTPADQLDLINGMDGVTDLNEFGHMMDRIDEELAAVVTPTPEPTAAITGGNGVAEMTAFFDRSLARRSLERLVQLPSDGPVLERVGYDTARLVIPKAEYEVTQATLTNTPMKQEEGEIICGWYTTFEDGVVAAIAIVNAASKDGGPYIDAFLILPEGVHPTVPNPSLKPTRQLDQDFLFAYPDGTYKLIRIVPSTS